jgi:hypothetical protein
MMRFYAYAYLLCTIKMQKLTQTIARELRWKYLSSAELGIMQKQSNQILHAECIRPPSLTPTTRQMSSPAINDFNAGDTPMSAIPTVRPAVPKNP